MVRQFPVASNGILTGLFKDACVNPLPGKNRLIVIMAGDKATFNSVWQAIRAPNSAGYGSCSKTASGPVQNVSLTSFAGVPTLRYGYGRFLAILQTLHYRWINRRHAVKSTCNRVHTGTPLVPAIGLRLVLLVVIKANSGSLTRETTNGLVPSGRRRCDHWNTPTTLTKVDRIRRCCTLSGLGYAT